MQRKKRNLKKQENEETVNLMVMLNRVDLTIPFA